ncbi:alcohol dehydrogenase catalytic domain-containing protein [Actinomadura atramentaria]|uniref:alcohol dehydrogenase catalytic domain-containing protein n=1 Tax=Actinomadura atramentaria TaxID=1990 RepID=UPI000527617E|nr:alcohol dehydrogenase catalytic domain-containing protein [Actinomadura atramentaria]
MLAVRAHRDSLDLHVERIAVPEPGPQDVLVRVASAGLAPGMMRLLEMGAFGHLPTTLGHEAAGTVAAVGDQVTGFEVGARVRVHPNLTCRSCEYCRTDREMMCAQQAMMGHAAFARVPMPLYDEYHDGGLAEYVRAPQWLVDPLPDRVNFDVGAKIHDLADAVRALKLADLAPGATIVVNAATGMMGTATVKLAPFFGVGRLILVGRSAARLADVAAISALPAETVATEDLPDDWETTGGLTRRILELVPGGVHAVLDYVPTGVMLTQAMSAMRTGGSLVHMGANRTPFGVLPGDMMVRCWKFVGTRACTRTDALEVLSLLGSGALNVDDLVTHRFALTDVREALTAMQTRSEPMWMTVLHP